MTEGSLNLCFKALSSEKKKKILSLLAKKTLSAGDIVKNFNLTGATISHHLKILSESKLIKRKRMGLSIYYSLNITEWNFIKNWFNCI